MHFRHSNSGREKNKRNEDRNTAKTGIKQQNAKKNR